jgi:hypothetical protein
MRTVVTCAAFCATIAIGVGIIQKPAAVASDPITTGHVADSRSGDRSDRFVDTRTGRMQYAPDVNEKCRRALFDNKTGTLQEADTVFCGPAPMPVKAVTSLDRLHMMQKTFQTGR